MMTTDQEFVIPLKKDDLLESKSGQFYVEELTPLPSISTALDDAGPRFIIKHFDAFFLVLFHGNKLAPAITLRAFDRIVKSMELLVTEMEKKFSTDESRSEYLCISKMHTYILCSLMSYLEDTTLALELDTVDRGKKEESLRKPEEREAWEDGRSKALLTIHRWLQLPLQNLWKPPTVEKSFVQLIADTCYKILENDKDTRNKVEVLEPIFQILGILVKNYGQKNKCSMKIIRLVARHEALALYSATGAIEMVTTNGCPDFIAELAREIKQMNLEETSAWNISTFLETIAADKPESILQILPDIIDYLSDECYSMRNCAINVLGVVIQNALTKADLTIDEKKQRDRSFDHLESHMLDSNTYVRSEVFQVLQELCCEGAIPVERYGKLMTDTIGHLREEDVTLRERVLVLLQELLTSNPFAELIDKRKIAEKRANIARNYENMEKNIVDASGDDECRELWKTMSPGIRCAIKDYIVQDSESREVGNDEYGEIRHLIHNNNFEKAVKEVSKMTRTTNVSLTDELDDNVRSNAVQIVASLVQANRIDTLLDSDEAEADANETNDGDIAAMPPPVASSETGKCPEPMNRERKNPSNDEDNEEAAKRGKKWETIEDLYRGRSPTIGGRRSSNAPCTFS